MAENNSLQGFSSGRFSCFTFEIPEEPKKRSLELNLDHSSIMTGGDISFTSDIFLREIFHVSHSKHMKLESTK
jgi:hypothetical protein